MSNVINYFSRLLQEGGWVDFIVIIGFISVSLFLVGHFMRSGPRKWVTFLAILFGGGLALSWSARRNRRLKKKIQNYDENIEELERLITERDELTESYTPEKSEMATLPTVVSAFIPDPAAEKERSDDEIVINGFVMKGDK